MSSTPSSCRPRPPRSNPPRSPLPLRGTRAGSVTRQLHFIRTPRSANHRARRASVFDSVAWQIICRATRPTRPLLCCAKRSTGHTSTKGVDTEAESVSNSGFSIDGVGGADLEECWQDGLVGRPVARPTPTPPFFSIPTLPPLPLPASASGAASRRRASASRRLAKPLKQLSCGALAGRCCPASVFFGTPGAANLADCPFRNQTNSRGP